MRSKLSTCVAQCGFMTCFVCALLLSGPAWAQATRYVVNGSNPGDRFGAEITAVGDVNGDGVSDWAAASVDRRVRIYSGADGAVLRSMPTPLAPDARFGHALAAAGAVDADGVPDLVVGAHGEELVFGSPTQSAFRPGVVFVYSGKTAQVILRLDEPGGGDTDFGFSVAGLGDVDADGHDDIAVGAPALTYHTGFQGWGSLIPGRAWIVSGADGALLHELVGQAAGDVFGYALAAVGDLDGDDVQDLAVSARQRDVFPPLSPESVSVFSGATGARLLAVRDPGHAPPLIGGLPRFGSALAGAGDLDGDGVPDILATAVGDPLTLGSLGQALLLSGADGSVLRRWNPTYSGTFVASGFGLSIAAGDVSGDGVVDVLVAHGGAADVAAFSGTDDGHLDTLLLGGGGGGTEVAVLGDVTGDGIGDFAVGEPGHDGSGIDAGRVTVVAGGSWAWRDLGSGVMGSGHFVPVLRGVGTLAANSLVEFRVDPPWVRPQPGGSFNTIVHGRLVLGTTDVSIPFHGGVLVPSPDAFIAFTGPGFFQSAVYRTVVPDGLPAGFRFFAQVVFLDPGAEQGISMTNAVQGSVP